MPMLKRNPEERLVSQDEKRRRLHYEQIRMRDLLLVPNLLSLARLLWAIPALLLIIYGGDERNNLWAAGLLLMAFLTDVLDGIWARTFKQISRLGKILDPVIDKIVVIGCALALGFAPRDLNLPLWLVWSIILRDLVILILANRVLREDKYLFTSSWSGKAATFAVAVTLLSYLLENWVPTGLLRALPFVSFGLLVLSGVDYLEKYWGVRHKRLAEREKRKRGISRNGS